ncbi:MULTISPECIES: hypothetical protein [unclassified Streptomyces]|uniref:hypothetical protein n=1 Tax=unclassified Streptomyces TaxID=2593676 RepID=UPI0035DE4064
MVQARGLLVTILTEEGRAGEFDVTDPELTAGFLTHAYAGPSHHTTGTDVTTAVQTLFRRVVAARPIR